MFATPAHNNVYQESARYFQHNHCNVCHPRTLKRVSRKRQILSAQSLQCLPPPHTTTCIKKAPDTFSTITAIFATPHTKTCIKKAPDTFSTITAMFATPAHKNVYQESARYFQHNHCNVCHPRTLQRVSRKRQILSAQSLQCLPPPHTKTCIKKAPDTFGTITAMFASPAHQNVYQESAR